jgi:hypothetical protein
LLVPAGESYQSVELALGPGEAAAVHLRESGTRHFDFSDLNNQEKPHMMLSCDTPEIGLGDTLTLTARILNTTTEPVNGVIRVKGLADAWHVEVAEGATAVEALGFGKSLKVVFKVKVDSEPAYESRITYTESSEMQHMDFAISPYIVLGSDRSPGDAKLDDVAHSVPTAIILKVKTEE